MFWVGAHCRVTACMGDGEVALLLSKPGGIPYFLRGSQTLVDIKQQQNKIKKPSDQVETNKERNVNEMYRVCALPPCDGLHEKCPP